MTTAVRLRSTLVSGLNGSIGLNHTAARTNPGCRRSRLAAMLAPLENPTAMTPSRSNRYVALAR
jgi:hypothetical protein